ncbi:MAG: discoidin domain-containing protein [Elusimicrobiota bacterium]|nr:discoidin domain-containing protein [Elusimicrobiota bacterium]
MNGKLRKRIATHPEEGKNQKEGRILDLINNAEVIITSEDKGHPVDNLVDGSRGRGSSQWLAGTSGPQVLIFKFDKPHHITEIVYEIEETKDTRTQEILLETSSDAGEKYRELVRQEYNFSPSGSTFQKEVVTVNIHGATSIKMSIKPDKGVASFKAKLNYIEFRIDK